MIYEDYAEADVLESDATETLPSSGLTWPGASAEQLRFMHRVYDINLQRSIDRGRTFVADVLNNELGTIEGTFQARTAAAADCVRLLAAARQAISAQGRVVNVGLTSAYRSASHQFRLWQQYFTAAGGYYERTTAARQTKTGGEHGEEAAQFTATFIRPKIAVPGFSNHNNGLAVDFLNVENSTTIPNKTTDAATQQWRGSWFWFWLTANAQAYNFFQNTAINEPWHWEYRTLVRPSEQLTEAAEFYRPERWLVDVADAWNEEEEVNHEDETTDLPETGGGTFRRLQVADVHYLSFEGGGGKGFVYTGAIRALQEVGVLRFANGRLNPAGPIKGISGASAGSITALLLSIGYDADAISTLMQTNNFNRFFDLPAIPSQVPQIGGCRNGGVNIAIRALEGVLSGIVALIIPIDIGGIRGRFQAFINNQLESFLRDRINRSDINDGPAGKLAKYPLYYLNDMVADLGIFSGCQARDFFDQLLFQKTAQRNLTFEQHFRLFGIKLVLTGSNLERGTSEYFSKDTTPNMPVADAVRISMGLPFIYKPYRISVRSAAEMGNAALAGLWVDGGVRNNLPIRAFENAPETRPHTLGIRLGEESVRRIDSIVDLLAALTIHQGLLGSGEAEISRTSGYRQQTVILSTNGLSLTDFNPPPATLLPRVIDAQTAITRYFDSRVPLREGVAYGANRDAIFEGNGQETTPQILLKITWDGVNKLNDSELSANIVVKAAGVRVGSGSGNGSCEITLDWKKSYSIEVTPVADDLYRKTTASKKNTVSQTATGTFPLSIAVGKLTVVRTNMRHVLASWKREGIVETKARDTVRFSFVGHRPQVNRQVLPRITRTQAAFDALPATDRQRIVDSLAQIGGFSVRTQTGTTGTFGNHSIGCALDINYNSDTLQNHHFNNDKDGRLLNLVEAVIRTQSGQGSFDIGTASGVAQLDASLLFNRIFAQWLYSTVNRLDPSDTTKYAEAPSPRDYSKKRLESVVEKAKKAKEDTTAVWLQIVIDFQLVLAAWIEGADLNGIRLYGMIPLDRQFLEIMLINGWRWGGNYKRTNKDYMHFEDMDAFESVKS